MLREEQMSACYLTLGPNLTGGIGSRVFANDDHPDLLIVQLIGTDAVAGVCFSLWNFIIYVMPIVPACHNVAARRNNARAFNRHAVT